MPGIMLDQNASKTLKRAKYRTMNHHRRRFLAIRPYVKSPEAAGQVEINLRRAALPFPPDCVAQNIFELRPVKGAFAGIDRGLGAAFRKNLENSRQRFLGPVPSFIGADALFRPRRQFDDDILEPKILVDRENEVVDL